MKKLLIALTLASSLVAGSAMAASPTGSAATYNLIKAQAVAVHFSKPQDADNFAKAYALSSSNVGPADSADETAVLLAGASTNGPLNSVDLLTSDAIEVVFSDPAKANEFAKLFAPSGISPKLLVVHTQDGNSEVVLSVAELVKHHSGHN